MARNSTERLVASTVWSREDPLFPAHGVNTTLLSIYKMWHHDGFKEGGVFAWSLALLHNTINRVPDIVPDL